MNPGGPKVRQALKSVAADVLCRTKADRLISGLGTSLPLVVCYHRVLKDGDLDDPALLPGIAISCSMLAQHLEWLQQNFAILPLDELGPEWKRGADRRVAAVTFDDGYEDFYTNAFPILRREKIPAALFVITGLVESGGISFYDRLYLLLCRAFATWRDAPRELGQRLHALGFPPVSRLSCPNPYEALGSLLGGFSQRDLHRLIEALEKELTLPAETLERIRPVTWSMLREMQAEGVTIGSHTLSHPLLSHEPFQKVVEETGVSRHVLQQRLGRSIRHFAYPSGSFNPLVSGAVAAAGYEFGYTICDHLNPTYPQLTIPRKVFSEASCRDSRGRFSPSILRCYAQGLFSRCRPCGQDHGRPWPPRSGRFGEPQFQSQDWA